MELSVFELLFVGCFLYIVNYNLFMSMHFYKVIFNNVLLNEIVVGSSEMCSEDWCTYKLNITKYLYIYKFKKKLFFYYIVINRSLDVIAIHQIDKVLLRLE